VEQPQANQVISENNKQRFAAFTLTGLTAVEVATRRKAGQSNKVTVQSSRTYFQILQENAFSFINGVFFVIAMVLVSLGRWEDAVVVVLMIVGGSSINLYQEVRAKRQLDKIALLMRPDVTVIRDGQLQHVAPDEIVLGDLLRIEPGDQLVVDGEVVGDGRADVDESLLTGEVDLIPKQAGDELHSGSYCVRGSAVYEATRVGADTLAYRLTTGARAFRRIYTPLQREINLVIQVLLLVAIFFWILFGISYLLGVINLDQMVEIVAVVAGLVPIGLYLAITLAYALGAVRLAGQKAVIQQSNAIESLSHVNVLCLDKTGTLTSNRIQFDQIRPVEGTEVEIRAKLGNVAASMSTSNRTNDAIRAACPGAAQPVIAEMPFSSAYKWSGLVFDDGMYILGAPETLARAVPLTEEINEFIVTQSKLGLRVLLFAQSPNNAFSIDKANKPCLPANLKALAVLTFSDELRPNVRQTLADFAQAGVDIKIISGDNPRTVAALAVQAGLAPEFEVVSGPVLAELDEAQFGTTAQSATIFGRVTPEQKSKLVQSLRRQGNYVAMTGDGVNDVLSLKQANLSISMESGSQITRNIAGIVLLKDTFAALPHAFVEGQRIRNGVQDVVDLFMVRIFTFVLLIFAVELVTGTFPLSIRHNAIITTLVVGIPSIGAALWAKAGQPQQRSLIRSTLHFGLPSTLTLALVGLIVYLGYLIIASIITPLPDGGVTTNYINGLLAVPRSALVTILIFCGLLLIPFHKPPTQFWVGGQPFSGDWRYTLVALAMLIIYFVILAVPQFRELVELTLLGIFDYVILALIALVWGIVLRAVWRRNLLGWFLGVDLE
jgi:cation-transporting ATPase E